MTGNPIRMDHITRVRTASAALISAIDLLRALKKESDALDLGNEFTSDDFVGDNAHLTSSDIVAVTGTTLASVEALLAQGHSTNIYKVRA